MVNVVQGKERKGMGKSLRYQTKDQEEVARIEKSIKAGTLW
jgi:hypothetical protein